MDDCDNALVPSLEHLALVKVTTTLWNSVEFKGFLAEHSDDFYKAYSAIMEKVKKNVSELTVLPASMQSKITNIVKPIGNQIALCDDFFTETCGLKIDLPEKFFWTSEGAIDERKTAEELIKNGNLNITTRYKLACYCCLEDDVRQLWKELPQSEKKLYYSGGTYQKIQKQTLITFWTYKINGQMKKLDDMVRKITSRKSTVFQYAFEKAAIARNIAATKYFLEKLSPRQRKISLKRALKGVMEKRNAPEDILLMIIDMPDDDFNHIVCFLFSKLSTEQRINIIEEYDGQLLECFLDWPWQSSFIKMAVPMLPYLCFDEYEELLSMIMTRATSDFPDYDYLKLWREFWQESYRMSRKDRTNNFCNSLFKNFAEFEDSEVRRLFGEINLQEIKKYIFSRKAVETFENCIFFDNWESIEIFIHESICRKVISKNELKTLRDKLKPLINNKNLPVLTEKTGESEAFLKKLDDFIQGYDSQKGTEEPVEQRKW